MRTLLAVCVVAASLPLLAPAAHAEAGPAPAARLRTVLNDVHTDTVDVQYTDGRLALRTRVGTEPHQYFAPEDVLFQLRDNDVSRIAVPDVPEYSFLGAPGTPVWVAPQVQDFSLLFAGWDTESLPTGTFAGDTIDLRLAGVAGPGALEVFQTDSFGLPLRVFSSRDEGPRSWRQAVGSHVHANWAFTAPGRYTVTFEATATDPAGHRLSSGLVDYTWYVGGTSAADIPAAATTTTLTAAPATTAVGENLRLTGAVTPANASGWVEFADGATLLGHAAVTGGQATMDTTSLASGTHSLTARFVPRYSTDFTEARSAAVEHVVTGDGTPPPPTSAPTVAPTVAPTAASSSPPTTPPTTPPAAPSSPSGGSPGPGATTKPCVPAGPVTSSAGVVLADGHADYAVRLVGGKLVSQVKDGAATWRAPGSVVFHVVDKAATTVPGGTQFAFLGKPGDRIWQIPQTQQAGVLWLGWNTEELKSTEVSGDVTWRLDEVTGPGALAVFEFDPFGKPVLAFDSGDGVPDSYAVRLGTHAHGNWAFTKPGIYHVTFTHTAKLASGAQSSDRQTVTFAVGPVDPKQALPVTTSTPPTGTCAGDVAARARAAGLASTGFSVAVPLSLAGLALLGGAVCLLVARRRKSLVDGER
ncbi:TIGR03773 family transporter-associated surface protein [Amycolatopsis sp. A133]|uniref:TIGR03773 family transporter-associated surface protein n=1 Tax=Amycolatopsis sp. A133 TaxID=3064472 RepID=UPI0027F466F6|nr:TIGR03773 family transporter-associated surface protein [Amycolatopsis sp. A133]MDQ7810928.1 TIGR03773 family transporter-associated surface protein [Amycolatopsis sp. A133]